MRSREIKQASIAELNQALERLEIAKAEVTRALQVLNEQSDSSEDEGQNNRRELGHPAQPQRVLLSQEYNIAVGDLVKINFPRPFQSSTEVAYAIDSSGFIKVRTKRGSPVCRLPHNLTRL